MEMSAKPATALNLLLLAAASVANMGLLYIASHAPWWGVLPAALLFAFSNNTVFALLHESVHGLFALRPALNRWAGRFAACWFPTGLTIQRAFHLTHHRNNRSPSEQFDVLHPEDVLWLKYAQWYSIYTGLYWFIACAGVLLYACTPRLLRKALLKKFSTQEALQTGADSYIGVLDEVPEKTAKLEILAAVAWQAALIYVLDLSLWGWLSCYGAFALMWSSLQYTDHAFSPLNETTGAWNLWVPRWLRSVFLNYYLHLVHHQHPYLPWHELPKYADKGPRFFDVWRACLKGPRKVEDFPTFKQYDVLR